MRISKHPLAKTLLSLAIASAFPAQLMAASSTDTEIDALWQTIGDLQQQVAAAEEWKNPNTLIHMSGFGSVGYAKQESTDGSFNVGGFSPIFHYQYRDLLMLEAELDFVVTEAGDTEAAMEYFTLDLFLNDNAVLVMGKFLSPLGNFRQNLHPSWINKLPSAPAGFMHDQAAPNADVGIQLRGGFKLGAVDASYAVYAGNGVAAEISGDGDEVEMVESPGMGVDGDGNKNYGGRFGLYYPDMKLELGFSWATGKISEREISGENIAYENNRDWDVVGMDAGYQLNGLNVKAEYIKQEIGALAASGAPEKAVFSANYVQVAYRFLPTKWEVVARTGEYKTPGATMKKTTTGVNYILASNIIAKLAFENNDMNGQSTDSTLLQLAYGF